MPDTGVKKKYLTLYDEYYIIYLVRKGKCVFAWVYLWKR